MTIDSEIPDPYDTAISELTEGISIRNTATLTTQSGETTSIFNAKRIQCTGDKCTYLFIITDERDVEFKLTFFPFFTTLVIARGHRSGFIQIEDIFGNCINAWIDI